MTTVDILPFSAVFKTHVSSLQEMIHRTHVDRWAAVVCRRVYTMEGLNSIHVIQ